MNVDCLVSMTGSKKGNLAIESREWLLTGEKALRQRADKSGNYCSLARVKELWLDGSPLFYVTPDLY